MQQPQDFTDFKSLDFPKILVDLYRHGFYWATFDHLQLLQFRLWLSQGNWKSGYYLEINSQFHNLFDSEDEIHNFQVPLLEDGTTDGWFPPYQFESDLLDCQYINVFGESLTLCEKIRSNQLTYKKSKELIENQKKFVFVGHDDIGSSCLPITDKKYDSNLILNDKLITPISFNIPKNRKERRERERQIKKQNNK